MSVSLKETNGAVKNSLLISNSLFLSLFLCISLLSQRIYFLSHVTSTDSFEVILFKSLRDSLTQYLLSSRIRHPLSSSNTFFLYICFSLRRTVFRRHIQALFGDIQFTYNILNAKYQIEIAFVFSRRGVRCETGSRLNR